MRRFVSLNPSCGVLLAALMAAGVAQPCRQTAGPHRAQELVRQCLEVSPATHPPCNAANPCALIRDEIRRGCALLTSGAPAFCRNYPARQAGRSARNLRRT
ncbi:MAG: hypothetical protein ACREFK_02140 [Stellaceae bacterium]